MKFIKLCALLALTQIELHSNFFGNKKPTAKFDEDQLQAIEDALEKNDTSALDDKIKEHENTISSMQNDKNDIENAISEAFSMNGLTLTEGMSVAEAIASLGTKCKEYGNSTNTHSIPPTDGVDVSDDDDDDESAKYAHNQVMNDKSKFSKIN